MLHVGSATRSWKIENIMLKEKTELPFQKQQGLAHYCAILRQMRPFENYSTS